MIDRLITIIIVAALIAWCVLAVHYRWSMQSTQRRGLPELDSSRLSIGLSAALLRSSRPLGAIAVTTLAVRRMSRL
jgi:hypothetical protein